MKLKKLTAAVLAVMMVLSLSACASENVKWIATNNGKQVPSGIYLTYMLNAYSQATGKVADQDKDVMKQEIDGVPAAQWIQNKTDESFKRHIAIENQAAEQGIVISDIERAYIDQQIGYQWQFMGAMYEKNGISYDSYAAVSQNAYLENMLFEAQYGAKGKTPIPDADILKAFQDGYYKTLYVSMSLLDNEGKEKDEAGKKAVIDKANEVYTKATAEGANYSDVILAYEKEQAVAKGEEESSVHEHTESSHVSFIPKDSTGYDADFLKQIGEMKNDDIRVITTSSTVYVLKKLDITENPLDVESYRTTVMKTLKGEEYNNTILGWVDAVTVDYNPEAKKLYTPNKLKF
ncbi:hypothetical protein [Hydrogenoanaerobacterium sp.]|uniref:hypothetical protein n=1 Tax=Hydrogenoanaerobacterium sp. TaxID=2953763 RepID=UPI00289DAAF8|nr:hypothetical protein [Hydrogenoanaerobacterium sp.]